MHRAPVKIVSRLIIDIVSMLHEKFTLEAGSSGVHRGKASVRSVNKVEKLRTKGAFACTCEFSNSQDRISSPE